MAQQIRYYKQDGTEYDFSKNPKITIDKTSNADMNIGVSKINNMAQQTDHIGDTNKMVTAVEWLIQELRKPNSDVYIDVILEQAKQMEKEQIIHAWREGDNDSMYDPKELDQQAEQYYNENYEN